MRPRSLQSQHTRSRVVRRRRDAGVVVLALVVVSVGLERRARATETEPMEGWYIMPGPTVEAVFPVLLGGTGGSTVAVGGELSMVCYDCLHSGDPNDRTFRDVWLGGYADAIYDQGRGQTRVSFGPEIGYFAGGIDAGLVVAHSAPWTHFGLTVRGMLGVGAGNVFLRATYLPQHHGVLREVTLNLGLSLKLPVHTQYGFDFL